MNATFAELDSLAPPSDDGAIERALTELESKLCAWSNAMTTANNVLADECRRTANRAAPIDPPRDISDVDPADENPTTSEVLVESDESHDSADVAPMAGADSASGSENEAVLDRLSDAMRHSEHLAREVGVEDGTENPNVVEPSPQAEATDEDVEEILDTIDSTVAAQLRARHAEANGKYSLREICDEYFQEVAESEKLLSALEPEMAKAIRVQYRLFNGRKSIRQLVDQYEPPKESSKKKRTWWRG